MKPSRLLSYPPLLVVTLCSLSVCQVDTKVTAGEIYKKASPAVVLIELRDQKGDVTAAGSGFLVSSDSKILTNYHVIAHYKQVTVRLANKDAYDEVGVLDIDKRKDIALIKIRAVDLLYLALGKSASVDVGDTVFSLSNPLGMLENTLSQGIISGIRLGDGYRYFQISAPISHGSSGGPIFNLQGEVIGIAAATLEEGQNLNFAVPVDYAKGMLTATLLRSLESVYDPESPKKADAAVATSGVPTVPKIPEDMKASSLVYLEKKLHIWSVQDAKDELGDSISYREGPPSSPADIFTFNDPTKQFRVLELSFSKVDMKLIGIFAYPWNATWDQCKQLWGDNVRTMKNADGTKFHLYKDRHLNVLVDKRGTVLSVGLY